MTSESDKVDASPVLDAIEDLKREAAEAGYTGTDPRGGWHHRLTGQGIHGTIWEHRILRARKRGWILRGHHDEFMALVAQKRPLEERPPARVRPPVPRVPSAPLGAAFQGEGTTVTVFLADEICIKQLGVHPAAVYGDAWWEVA